MTSVKRDRWLVLLIFVLGMLATLLIARAQQDNAELRAHQLELLTANAQELRNAFNAELQRAFTLLRSASWLFNSSESVERSEFHNFAGHAVQASDLLEQIEWLPRVTAEQREKFVAQVRHDGLPDFDILEPATSSSAKLQPAAPRQEYFPVLYVEPARNSLLGLNRAWSGQQRQLLELVRTEDRPIATEVLHDDQAHSASVSLTLMVPVFESQAAKLQPAKPALGNHLLGYISGKVLLGNILQEMADKADNLNADLMLFDMSGASAELILKVRGERSDLGKGPTSYADLRVDVDRILLLDVAGRQWHMVLHPRPGFFVGGGNRLVLTWLLGPLVSFLLAFALYRLLRNRRALEEAQQLLREVTDHLPIGVFQTHSSYKEPRRLTFVNQNASAMLGVPIDRMLAKLENAFAHVIKEDQLPLLISMDEAKRKRGIWDQDFRIRLQDQMLWMHARATPREMPDGSLIYNGYVRDITERKQSELAVAKLLKFQQELIDTIPSPIFFKGPDARFLGCNRAYEQAFGITRQYLTGKTVLDLDYLPEADRIAYHAEDVNMIAHAQTAHREFPIVYADGKSHDILYWVSGFHLETGEPGGLVGAIVDISQQKRAQAALQEAIDQQNAIFDSAPLGIAELKNRYVVRCNRKWEEMLGYQHGELDGRPSRCWYPNDESHALVGTEVYMVLGKGETYSGDWLLQRKDGSQFWCHVSARMIKADDLAKHSVWQFEDITDKRNAELELRRARDAAEEATRAKSMFLANMSHEIRTPMNAVIGLAHLALKTELTPKQRDYLGKIHHSALALLAVINDILDFSKIEAGRIELEHIEFSLDHVMQRITNTISHDAADRGLELLFDIKNDVPSKFIGDPSRLGQILLNLVANSIKFTELGEVIVRCELLERNEKKIKLQFSVIDSGIGMSQEASNRLFQPFTQADGSTTRKYGGTGLGLTICKRLVDLMGGSIWVESEPGAGTTFHFTCWFGNTEFSASRIVPAELNGLNILIVDDNAAARMVLASQLEFLPFVVSQATSGREAIAAVRVSQSSRPFDLILMDWKMPEMTGIDAARAIRQDKSLKKQPAIVMVTAYDREEIERDCEGLQLEGFLIKPISQSTLVDTLVEIYVPQETDELISQSLTHAATYDLTGMRLLVVEDNEVNQQIAMELLQAVGAVVEIAVNGQHALDMLASTAEPYQVVLMDLQMPLMDGYEATRIIRANPRYADLPIIAMTAHATVEERQRCLDIGMAAHITKPIDPDLLYQTLARWHEGDSTKARRVKRKPTTPTDFDLPGINVKSALKRVAGNEKLYRQLLEQFALNQAASAQQMQHALAAGKPDVAMNLAHSIKGAAGNLGMEGLSHAAGDLEQHIARGQEPHLALMQFEQELKATLDVLKQVKKPKTRTKKSQQAPSPKDVHDILDQLAVYLNDYDAEALDYIENSVAAISAMLPRDDYKRLLSATRSFDFISALESLKKISSAMNTKNEDVP